jgi:DNA polymerase-3 subunit epsilon
MKNMNTFTAIDFETATGFMNSTCAVGIVSYENGKLIDEFYSLIKPPDNYYWYWNTKVHGITSFDTKDSPKFHEVYPEVRKRLKGRLLVAHNESFDRNVLFRTMQLYGLSYNELSLSERWECTCRIYRAKGFKPASLGACCEKLGIDLNHHHALSDAHACARLYLMK